MASGLDLADELFGLVGALEREGVEYALAGALALAVHGVPRATADIDLLIHPDLGRRLESRVDYTPSGVERRLRRAAALRDLCRRLRAKR